jgi:hypothetical protein
VANLESDMAKVSVNDPFFKSIKRDLCFGHLEANFLAYISEFEEQGLTCFASRKHISKELLISETRVQDVIKRLVKAGAVFIEYRGLKRVLRTNPDRHKGIGIQPVGDRIPPPRGSESNQQRDRNPINTKIHIQRSNYKDNLQRTETDPSSEKLNGAARKFGLKKIF